MFEEPLDRVSAAILQNRRTKEAERRKIIFDDKERTIGVDKEALDLQLKEKKDNDEAEKEKQKASDAEIRQFNRMATILDHRQKRQKHEIAKDVASFRKKYQQPSSRREFDLNDPKRLHKLSLEEAQMIIPGLTGEDPNSKDRKQRQREQFRDWVVQQHVEQQTQRHQQEMEDQNYNQFMVEVNNMAKEVHNLALENRRSEVIATMEFNLAMSEEKRHQETREKDSGLLDSMDGEMHDVSPKSIVERERSEIIKLKAFQQQQIDDKKRQNMHEKKENYNYDRIRVDSARTAALVERQQAKLNKEMRKHLDSTNQMLAETRKQLKPDIARGAVTDRFFSQFNTSSR